MAFADMKKFSGYMTGTNRSEAFHSVLARKITHKRRLALDELPTTINAIDEDFCRLHEKASEQCIREEILSTADKSLRDAAKIVTAYCFKKFMKHEYAHRHRFSVENCEETIRQFLELRERFMGSSGALDNCMLSDIDHNEIEMDEDIDPDPLHTLRSVEARAVSFPTTFIVSGDDETHNVQVTVTKYADLLHSRYVKMLQGTGTGADTLDPDDVSEENTTRARLIIEAGTTLVTTCRCDCLRFETFGVPCRHICALECRFPRASSAIPLEFHSFWQKTGVPAVFPFSNADSFVEFARERRDTGADLETRTLLEVEESNVQRNARVYANCVALGRTIGHKLQSCPKEQQDRELECLRGILREIDSRTGSAVNDAPNLPIRNPVGKRGPGNYKKNRSVSSVERGGGSMRPAAAVAKKKKISK